MLPQHSEYSEKLNSAEHGLKSAEQKPEALNVARATEPVAIWFAIGMALLMQLGIGCVVKMASHIIFQYIILAIDDTYNTWTNMIVEMIILFGR